MKRGVFWLIDGQLCCYPFDGSIAEGIAKSGNTYNHKKLWEYIRPKGRNKAFDYYPRGRVEITSKGKAIVYMSPHIGNEYIAWICEAFELDDMPVIKYDYSEHYHCHFDWETKSLAPDIAPLEFEINVEITPKNATEEIKPAIITNQINVDFDAFAESVEELLTEYYGLKLINEDKLSDNSHYYSFLAKDKVNGKILFEFRFELRIENHPVQRATFFQKSKRKEAENSKNKELIKDISKYSRIYYQNVVVNKVTYDTYEAAFVGIDGQIDDFIDNIRR